MQKLKNLPNLIYDNLLLFSLFTKFLGSIFDILKKPKNKTKPGKEDDFFFEDNYSPSPQPFFTTAKPQVTKINTDAASDDVFYRLKAHCAANYDQFCITKKKEIHDLVVKCEKIKAENKGKTIEACSDVMSIYCYVFKKFDFNTCYMNAGSYSEYVPGKKKFTPSPTKAAFSTQSTRKIPIVIITSAKSTTTTTTTSMPKITTRSTIKPTTGKPSIATSNKPSPNQSGNDLISPFDGPVTTVTIFFFLKIIYFLFRCLLFVELLTIVYI
jgi:hypothetical protein